MSSTNKITMGILAKKTGCNVETVRYYEKTGLMPEPPRSEGGHRLYTFEHVKRLAFIRRCRELGFSIEEVKNLLGFIDEPGHTCGEVKAMTMQHAKEIRQKIKDLTRLEKALKSMAGKCDGEKYSADQCPIIDLLYER
jgi:MerR family transcriptional regulator, mercuric resistance operon regulatory protein